MLIFWLVKINKNFLYINFFENKMIIMLEMRNENEKYEQEMRMRNENEK